ncbi:hypothetical protein ACHAXA_001333 [Cyclostephanos tholiformis]|uniref:Plastidal glycolate/glycerate translocator 1, chloroplastic n=1 Tax=Cyclostephanos tholiformis TaxID=382380 RepID=A0ABD3RJT0_9STRA
MMRMLAPLLVLVVVANISPSLAFVSNINVGVGLGPSPPPSRLRLAGPSSSMTITSLITATRFAPRSSTSTSSRLAATDIPSARRHASAFYSPSSSWPSLWSSSSSRILGRPIRGHHPTALLAADDTATSSSSPRSSSPVAADDAGGTALAIAALIILDVGFRFIFARYSIPFPSSLAGCGALFVFMITLNAIGGGDGGGVDVGRGDRTVAYGERIYRTLNPGAMLLAKWLPVFFVPSLITLPLARGLGNVREVLKVLSVIVGGFMFTLFTTSWSVLGIRKLTSGGGNENCGTAGVDVVPKIVVPVNAQGGGAPFGKTLFRTLKAFAWIAGLSCICLTANSPASMYVGPLRSSHLLFVTLSAFVYGSNLPKSFTRVVHPLVTCTCLTWLAIGAFASFTGSTFLDVLGSYRTGTMSPLIAGPGDLLLSLLGPAVVALSCQMYGRRKLMRENVPEVAVSTLVSSVGGLYGTAMLVRMLRISDNTLRLSLLSRNITSPLAMAIASILGANASLAVTMVVVTGLFGANFGASILDVLGIRDGVARGLGIGAAAHGLGTAAFANEEDAFPFAAISMALTASACTVLVSLPMVRKSIVRLALGA